MIRTSFTLPISSDSTKIEAFFPFSVSILSKKGSVLYPNPLDKMLKSAIGPETLVEEVLYSRVEVLDSVSDNNGGVNTGETWKVLPALTLTTGYVPSNLLDFTYFI